MKTHWRLVAVLAVLLTLAFSTTSALGAAGKQARLLVTFEDGVANSAARATLESHGGIIQRELENAPFTAFSVVLPEQATPALTQAFGVARVEVDAVVHAVGKPPKKDRPGNGGGDPPPAQALPWGVDRIDAELSWATSRGAGVKIGIIDTGISKSHPDLAGNLKGGVNFVAQKGRITASKWDDDNGHGSHVAGIAAAVDNDEGVIGVAPDADLYAIKVLDRRGSGFLSDVIDGIYWSINNGMDVINMSLGCNCDIPSLQSAVDAAAGAGVVVVAAAGNAGSGADTVIYPAKYSSAIAVAATDNTDARASFSSTGPTVEMAAPGVAIFSTWKNGDYNTISGTSMASPRVAAQPPWR